MTKETILIALIILALVYYYYQNQANAGANQPSSSQPISELTRERDQWKNDYEEQKQAVTDYLQSHYATNFTELNEKINGQAQKITDLETALLNLARQKIKGQKDAEELLNQLRTKWQQDKASWQAEQKKLITNCATNYNLAQQLIQELQTKKNWGQNHLPQIKKELFSQGQETFAQLQATVNQAYFSKGKNDVEEKLAKLGNFFIKNKPPLSYSEIVAKK